MFRFHQTLKLAVPSLAAALIGCNLADKGQDGPPAGAELALSLKSTDECVHLRDSLAAATDGVDAIKTVYLQTCVEEIEPGTDGTLEPVPEESKPDPVLRCDWIEAGITEGRKELVVSYTYYCAENCAALSQENPEAHAKLCVAPKEDSQPKDPHPVELVLE